MTFTRTLPAGYMEIGESATEGAIRETWEEAGAEVEVISPFAQLDIPRIGQVRELEPSALFRPLTPSISLSSEVLLPCRHISFSWQGCRSLDFHPVRNLRIASYFPFPIYLSTLWHFLRSLSR